MTVILVFFSSIGLVWAGQDNLMGTVTQSEQGFVLNSVDGNYVLIGKALSKDLVGKKVKVNGTIADTGKGKTMSVDFIEEIKK